MDANEYALKVGPAAKSLGVAIRSAQWLGKGVAPSEPITTIEPVRVESPAPSVKLSSALPLPKAPSAPLAAEEATAPPMPAPAVAQTVAPATSELPLPAAAIPPAAPSPPQVSAKALGTAHVSEHVIRFGDRRYRVRGLEKNLAYEVLKVNVLICRAELGADDPTKPDLAGVGEIVHVDTFDLYQARHRAAFARCAAVELGLAHPGRSARQGRARTALEAPPECAAANRAVAVMNPHAHHLTFLDDRTRTRRDHEKYLTLIDVIALLHQHQRVQHTAEHNGQILRYVEVTLEDIALANQLAHEVLGRTLDELPPQTRRLLCLVVEMVDKASAAQQMGRAQHRFSRRQVCEYTRRYAVEAALRQARGVGIPARASRWPGPVLRVRAAIRRGGGCAATPERPDRCGSAAHASAALCLRCRAVGAKRGAVGGAVGPESGRSRGVVGSANTHKPPINTAPGHCRPKRMPNARHARQRSRGILRTGSVHGGEMKRRKKPRATVVSRERDVAETSPFYPYLVHFLEWFAARGYSPQTLQLRADGKHSPCGTL